MAHVALLYKYGVLHNSAEMLHKGNVDMKIKRISFTTVKVSGLSKEFIILDWLEKYRHQKVVIVYSDSTSIADAHNNIGRRKK